MNRVSSVLVLSVSALVLAAGLLLGINLLLADAPANEDAEPTCTNRTVKAGETLSSNLVKVNVLNASQKSGLANRVSINLQRRGFLAGGIGNATGLKVGKGVTILADDRDDPIVHLVAIQFGRDRVAFAKPTANTDTNDSVTVVINEPYKGLVKKAATSFKSPRDVTLCVMDLVDE